MGEFFYLISFLIMIYFVEDFGNISGGVSSYARFKTTTNKYIIIWLNYDDSLIDTTKVTL